MIRFLQTKWIVAVVGTLAYALTTWFCLHPRKQIEQTMATLGARRNPVHGVKAGPSWTFENPEISELTAELKSEREALRVRASQLDELEARLQAERQEIYAVTQAVYQLRADLDKVVTRVSEEEAVNLKKLAKVYTTMSTEGAARILKAMDDDQVVKILSLMRGAESAPILEGLGQGGKDDAKRAATISNRLRLTLSATTNAATTKAAPP
jgi:flagellar motility protein MotE (MotC chaperone)